MKRKMSKLLSFLIAFTLVVSFTGVFSAQVEATEKGLELKKIETTIKPKEIKVHEGAKRNPEPPICTKINDVSKEEQYSAKKGTGTASLNGITYETIQDAVDAANDGETVKVLADTIETVYISKSITLDLNGKTLSTVDQLDVITVDALDVKIINGILCNFMNEIADIPTAIYVYDNASVYVEDVSAMTVGADSDTLFSAAFYVSNQGYGEFINCEVFYDENYVTEYDYVYGAIVSEGAEAVFIGCNFETLYGDACYVDGSAYIEKCYFAGRSEESSAIVVDEGCEVCWIESGYFYGDCAVYAFEYVEDGSIVISEGEFVSMFQDFPALYGDETVFECNTYTGKNIIKSPSNWMVADEVFVYEGVNAPSKVSSNLTNAKGATAGYDDIKVTWGSSSNADGYRVNYKAGTGSYSNSKYYSKSATRSRTVNNLSDGVKYTFKVTPYVKVNEDILENGGTKCYSNKYKTSYTYTLKKITLNSVAGSGSKVNIKWKNINGETGYQISQSTSKTGTKIVDTYKTTSGKSRMVEATKGKTYYYKVRAYKTVDGKNIYGPWSAVKAYKR